MRLLDELRQPELWGRLGPHMQKALSEAQVVVADQVTEYMFAMNEKEYWNTEDFPNMSPPFQIFWIETVRPSKIVSEAHGELRWEDEGFCAEAYNADGSLRKAYPTRPSRWGALFIASSPEVLLTHPGAQDFYAREELLRECRWALNVTMFAKFKDEIGPMWAWSMPIRHDGTIWKKWDNTLQEETSGLSYTLVPEARNWPAQGPEGRQRYKSFRYEAHAYGNPLFLAVCFMHAKNATLTYVHPNVKLNRRRVGRGYKPILSYRVLEVAPIRRVLEQSRLAHEKGTDIQLALHRCRGHFKTYTSAAPLLGRHVGTWFWEETVRGHGQHAVRKEYRPTTKEKL